MTSSTKLPTGLDCLPGVSYLPDKIEIEMGDEIVGLVVTEFLDFLSSLTDLMKLMHTVKTKHLRSLTPMPTAVLREIMTGDTTGPRYKAWDKSCSGAIPGISSSADNMFRSGQSSGNILIYRPKPVYRNREQQQKKRGLDTDLIEVTGKKTKPIWHVVALEAPTSNARPLNNEDERHHKEDHFVFSELLNKKNRPIHRTKSQQLLVNINAASETNVKPSNPAFLAQMDMMLATDGGFTSVADHKAYLDTQKPHWYKDIVLEAYKIGILYRVDVLSAFEALGIYYEATSTSITYPKTKLCFLVMSMPVWDVCQAAMQKALDYFLHVVLEIRPESNTLSDWLRYRKLPYLVQPPLSPEMVFMTRHSTTLDSKSKKSDNTADD